MRQSTPIETILDRGAFEAALREAVGIATVSMDPTKKQDIKRGAQWAAQFLRHLGAQVDIVNTPGNPVVWGRFQATAGAPTLAIYNHLDVQPAEEPEWATNPFDLLVRGDRYIGRGTTDDKGPALALALAAQAAHRSAVNLNLHFYWEFEEEIGSPNFDAFLAQVSGPPDSVLVSDTIWVSRSKPVIPVGLRGMQTAKLLLRTAEHDAHSGLTGGAARNPIAEICDLVATLLDAQTGTVKIPGFYDAVRPVSESELTEFLDSGFDAEEFRRVHGFHSLRYHDSKEVTRRIWALPTLEVHGIAGGYQGPGIKSIVPPWAEAKISMRLVPDQRPELVLRRLSDFVALQNPDVVVESETALEPYLAPLAGPHLEALRLAMTKAFGTAPALVREGGSIGAVAKMRQRFNCPVLFLGLSLPEHGYHAPNECFDWSMAQGGAVAAMEYFQAIAHR